MDRSPATSWSPIVVAPTTLVRPVRLDSDGVSGPTRGEAEGPRWIRVHHGWYVPATAPRHLPEQLILEQSVRLPAAGAVTGWAACRLHGAAYFDGRSRSGGGLLPVPLAVGPHSSLAASAHALPLNHVLLPADRTTVRGVPTVCPARALYDAVRTAPSLREAVVAIDMAAAARICSPTQLVEYAREQPQDRARVLAAAAHSSPHSLSPPEVEVRLACEIDAGLPRLEVNCEVLDEHGRLVAVVDLLDVEAGLVIEVDGAHHWTGRQAAADLGRTDRLIRLGLEVCRFTGADARRRRLVEQRVALARSRCAFTPPGQRRWSFRRRGVEVEPWSRGA